MIEINFLTISQLIFSDKTIQEKLPEFYDLFQQWKLGQQYPGLKPMAQKALLDSVGMIGGLNRSVMLKNL